MERRGEGEGERRGERRGRRKREGEVESVCGYNMGNV